MYWNVATQRWEVEAVFDELRCQDCTAYFTSENIDWGTEKDAA